MTSSPVSEPVTPLKDIELILSGRRYRLSSNRPEAIAKIPEPDRTTLLNLLGHLQAKAPQTRHPDTDTNLNHYPDQVGTSVTSAQQQANRHQPSSTTSIHAPTGSDGSSTQKRTATSAVNSQPSTPKSAGDIAAIMAGLAEQERAELKKRMDTRGVWKWFGIIVLIVIGLIMLL